MTIIVDATQAGHVGEIRFSRPPLNFASPELLAKIADAVERFDLDPEVRCTVLSAEGKSFCAGADLAGDKEVTGDGGMEVIARLYVQAERLFRRKKPMIAAVQGAAIGAGLGLAMVADFRVAAPAARFSANFVRLGFHPGFAITAILPRLIGPQRAGWMLLSAARIKPDQALEWGLVDRVAPEGEVIAAAHGMAKEIAENAPLAVAAVRSTWLGSCADEAVRAMRHEHAQQAILKRTEDYAEGVASVFERRDAKFVGR